MDPSDTILISGITKLAVPIVLLYLIKSTKDVICQMIENKESKNQAIIIPPAQPVTLETSVKDESKVMEIMSKDTIIDVLLQQISIIDECTKK